MLGAALGLAGLREAGLLSAVVLALVRCPTGNSYGAIAFSAATGRSGASSNYCTRSTADRRAVSECGRVDCRVEVWLDNNCGALAAGKGGWAYAVGDAQPDAERLALSQCASRGGTRCRVAASLCSRGLP
jgi:hypothetical protein